MKLRNKIAVVTGASSGIGEGIAKRYAEEGAKVVIAARRKEKLKAVQCRVNGETAICACDVSDIKSIDYLVTFTRNTYNHVDILVANAGVTDFTHVRDVTETLFDKIININYKGLYFTVQRFLPIISKGASIILTSSIATKSGFYSHSLYSSSKSAVTQLGKNFAIDLGDDNIRVNTISPGPVDTPIFDIENTGDPDCKEKVKKLTPFGMFGKVTDIANLAVFLASDESKFMTGQDIVMDGGMSNLRKL